MPAVVAALKLVPELTVDVMPSSCCGMAGAFGYQPQHLDVSLRMAEAALLPAVRNAGADTVIVADGTSCRHQIHDGAQRERAARRARSRRCTLTVTPIRSVRLVERSAQRMPQCDTVSYVTSTDACS